MNIEYKTLINSIKDGSIVINGASYIGEPIDQTIMYITKKVEHLIVNISGHAGSVVIAERGIELDGLDKKSIDDNIFVFSDNPQMEYANIVNLLLENEDITRKVLKYQLTKDGYYLGENTDIGENTYIEPNCYIGHGVKIGNNCKILYGAVIKNSIIGDNVLINEYAVIGANGFTMAEDDNGNKYRIPTIGKVIIGNNCEIGAHDNISRGSAGYTRIEDYVKLDALVHVGHDAHIEKNVEVTAGGIIGGFAHLNEGVYIGVNSSIRNRISIGENTTVGMGSNVIRSIDKELTVVGNPAKPIS